jgi:hypothetical protein
MHGTVNVRLDTKLLWSAATAGTVYPMTWQHPQKTGIYGSTAVGSTSKLTRHTELQYSSHLTGKTHAQWDKTIHGNYRSWRQSTLNFLLLGMAYFSCHEYTQMFCVWHTGILINPSTSASVNCTALRPSPVVHLCELHGPPSLTSRSPLCTALRECILRKPEFKTSPACKVVGISTSLTV